MSYISNYTVAITYRWRLDAGSGFRYQTTYVTVEAPSREVAIARAMGELNVATPIYVTEVEVPDQSEGWYEYE